MMTDLPERYDRNILLFGAEGQKKLRAVTAIVFGAGGLGSVDFREDLTRFFH
jgi:molybdopterin/thiamine biosynthesis adenylyltransferase